ncbi:hypothetical protein A3860_05230 [Niastella vici]|uniref:SusD/RagB family nutrient-binding outer membrane lipoprotein n=1 Tax=Niastella vici TaxID=1703345 RepID=A0A1V9FS03_9BACT|nr:SusD/RagB family nutrient-binding outer membrane lipoprotein [Niastella vici]OQP61122.1 hypothetical protein A3860_05230 [Niastella vici]
MRKIYKYFRLSVLFFAFIIVHAGCKKGWLDVNYNPRQLTENNTTPDLVLPTVLLGYSQNDIRVLEAWMGYWCMPYGSSGTADQTYNGILNSLFGAGPSDEVYYLEEKASQSNQTFYVGIAKILKALAWSRCVDVFNNVPYTEAFDRSIRRPRYDDAKFIYEDQIRNLDSGIVLIKGAQVDRNVNITHADIMFHGNKNGWIKFANTLKLRLLVHQANRPDRAAYILAEIAKIKAEGSGFLNTGEDAAVNPGFQELKPNPFYGTHCRYYIFPNVDLEIGVYTWEISSANTTAMNFLKENNDPRLGFFYSPTVFTMPPGSPEPFTQPSPDNFRGNRFGLPVSPLQYRFQSSNFVSQVGGVTAHGPKTPASTGIIKGYDMDAWVITSVESLFLQAEAIQRGWLAGNAEEAYKNAVKESFRWLNVGGNSNMPSLSDAVFNTWYGEQVTVGNQNVSWSAAPDKYKVLMFQKYLAFNGIEPFEIYTDYRRNGAYPNIPLSFDPGRTSRTMPIRMPYPETEYTANRDNVNAQGVINIFTSKIWWMP